METKNQAAQEAIANADAHLNNVALPNYSELNEELSRQREINAELLEAIETLVKLHHDWDKGTAYVQVSFYEKNKEAIAKARNAIAKAESA